MNFKLSLIAAAVLATASAPTFAAIADSNDRGSAGSGDLFFSVVSTSNNISAAFDLGVSLAEFTTKVSPSNAGVTLVWDLNSGTFTDHSADFGGTAVGLIVNPLTYGNIYSLFGANGALNAADLKFDVKAMDGLPSSLPAAGLNRYLSTSTNPNPPATNSQVFQLDAVDVYPVALNADTTNSTHVAGNFDQAGANLFDNGDASNVYFQQGSGDNWKGQASFTSTGSADQELFFYFLTNTSSSSGVAASVTQFAGKWSFFADEGQLVFSAVPVPEPETYAMLLAGLGLVGYAVRRRRNFQG